ncbi:hypothetical protein DFP72DRAFT_449067 [Ephemerocybe angulata]|uniref:Uncharacterized protein n=1 Tax=Ephemerocybe angulata TaxID=980116 RepID=A0A8H6HT35_9AGAR|nr:hypothetical protein DFP72DRAFT_449067 [Tulosesus angulatus]
MHFSTISAVLGTLMVLGTTVQAQEPSNTPGCWVCPAEDRVNYPLTNTNYDASPFVCIYGDDDIFNCSFSSSTGVLVEDNNLGLCPAAAIENCSERRAIMRRRALPHAPAAPVPAAREVKPGLMHTRTRLGESKKRLHNHFD